MKEVNVKVEELLKIVKDNREKHNTIYQAALEGYWKKAAKLLADRLKDVKKHKKIDMFLSLPFPENHEEDYNRILKMLELSTDTIVTLDEISFSQIVLNNWNWKHSFKTTNSSYIGFTGPSGSTGAAGAVGSLQDALDDF